MRIISIKLGDKTYMSGKLTTYLTKEALKIQRQALDLGKRAKAVDISDDDLDSAQEMLDAVCELTERKIWLICEAYGNKFTPDALERELTTDELDLEVNKIIGAASGVIEKN